MEKTISFRRIATVTAAATLLALSFGTSAALAQPEPFKEHLNSGGDNDALTCEALVDGGNTVARFCRGDPAPLTLFPDRTKDRRPLSWDGQPISADVTMPPEGNGPWPLVVLQHGYAGNKHEWETENLSSSEGSLNNIGLAKKGYAVLTLSTRGFGSSCGNIIGAATEAGADNGSSDSLGGLQFCPFFDGVPYSMVHLADARYEARDVQTLAGYLVDDGIAERAIGVLGESYGGGQALTLARLKDRVMQFDGTTTPWTSPDGTPMRIAAVGAEVPWSDLASALMPNGRSLDTSNYTSTLTTSPVGVKKDDWMWTLYVGGFLAGKYAGEGCPSLAPDTACPDLTGWFKRIDQGEPYEDGTGDALRIAEEVRKFHSAMGVWEAPGIDDGPVSNPPAPSFIVSGWTDDLFTSIEGLRFYQRATKEGGKSFFGLGDFGHPPAQNKGDAQDELEEIGKDWLDYYLKGVGPEPKDGIRAYTKTCPKDAPSGGPFDASDWSSLAQGEVATSSDALQTVDAFGGRQSLAEAIDPNPITGELGFGEETDICAKLTPWQEDGVATYRFPNVTEPGYTMLGMPTIEADVTVHGVSDDPQDTDPATSEGELTGRLWDVDVQRNTQTIVTKGVYRLARGESGKIVFQLQGNGWRFEPGHKPKVELLGRDDANASSPALGSFRAANNTGFTVDINSVKIALPTFEALGVVPPPPPPPPPPTATGGEQGTSGPPAAGDTKAKPGKKKKKKKKVACRKRKRSKRSNPASSKRQKKLCAKKRRR